jgi:DNA gyrase inhibitor GyrI
VAEVEEAVGSLRGRKFYGVFDGGEYRVCVQLRKEDEPAGLGLETGTLPGGRYAQVRLQGEPPAVYGRIAPAFERLARRPDRDPGRPGLEFYRRRDVIDLLLPVR